MPTRQSVGKTVTFALAERCSDDDEADCEDVERLMTLDEIEALEEGKRRAQKASLAGRAQE